MTQGRLLTIDQVWRSFEIGRCGQESDQASSGVNQTAKRWPATCGQRSGLGGVGQGVNPRSHENGGELGSCEIVRVNNKESHDWGKRVRIAQEFQRATHRPQNEYPSMS